jgi:hypothetical protein
MTESSTTILRRLLDERGAEWTYGDGTVSYKSDSHWCNAWEYGNGMMCVSMGFFTPEQAIAATLGAGTCHEVMIDCFFRGCGECGYMWEYMYSIGKRVRPNYCPNCGRKVVDA